MTAVLFAGGGTGGHIYPNLAIAEHLGASISVRFLVSERPQDAEVVGAHGYECRAVAVRPLPRWTRPWQAVPFVAALRRSVAQSANLLAEARIDAVVATGGFVSGPAVIAARRCGVPVALVNLDAIPGIANRYLARHADQVFTTYDSPRLPGARRIGLPLRSAATSMLTPEVARAQLGLDPHRPTLFITGATHGARSMIGTANAALRDPTVRQRLEGWQVLHQCGTHDPTTVRASYEAVEIPALVVDYCREMGVAWAASDLAIARAGAGTVAETWANAVPTVFLPNPHHPHQRLGLNARPLVEAGGAIVIDELPDVRAGGAELAPVLARLLSDHGQRIAMASALRRTCPTPGGNTVADWIRCQPNGATRSTEGPRWA